MIGVDIVEVKRIEKMVKDRENLEKIFTESELKYATQKKQVYQTLAGMFAAKEAVSKLFGTGMTDGVFFNNIIVRHRQNGSPYIELSGNSQELANKLRIKDIEISISHESQYAVAVALAVLSYGIKQL